MYRIFYTSRFFNTIQKFFYMENDDSFSSSHEFDSLQSNQFYYGKISQLIAESQRKFLTLKDNYSKCSNLIYKDNKIKNQANQKAKELFLLSTDPKNEENDKLFFKLNSFQAENKKLKKVYNYLFSALKNKTESGEIPNFILISYVALQNSLDKKSFRYKSTNDNTLVYSNKDVSSIIADIENDLNINIQSSQLQSKSSLLSSSSSIQFSSSNSPRSPQAQHTNNFDLNSEFHNLQKKLVNPSDIDILRFDDHRAVYNSGPPSPNRNSINSGQKSKQVFFSINKNDNNNHSNKGNNTKLSEIKTSNYEKLQAKSMLNFNISHSLFDHSKLNHLPKRTRSEMLNRASSISYTVSRLNDISDLTAQVGKCQKMLEKLDDKIDRMKLHAKKAVQKKIIKKHHFTLEKNVQSFNLAEYVDKGVNCDQIPSINEMKSMISKNAGEASQQMLAIQQLQYLQNYLNQLNIELKVILLANDRKMSDFKTIIANLKAIDPLFYGNVVQNLNFNTKLTEIKDKKRKRLEAIENRICEMKNQNDLIFAKNNDISFIIENLKKQRMKMMQIPKANVKQLCNTLQNDRLIVNEINRQITFLKIIQNHLEKKLIKLNERYSDQSFENMDYENELLKNKVDSLKNKFNHLRATREKHSFVLTNGNELKFLHTKIHDLISSIDVSKMRMGGLISKVEKQLKLLSQQQIPLPNPPHSYVIHQENVKKNGIHS